MGQIIPNFTPLTVPADEDTLLIYDASAASPRTRSITFAALRDSLLTGVDTIQPTITNVTSSTANGYYNAGDAISIQVTFSEAVIVTGTPTLALNSGGTATYASGSTTTTLTFAYTVQAGHNATDLDYVATGSLGLAGGTIKDDADNNAILTLPSPGTTGSLGANKAIIVDTTDPTVVSFVPANNSTGASTTANFTITFSEPVVVGTGNIVIIATAGPTTLETISVTDATKVTVAGAVVTINPLNALANSTAYHVTIAATAFDDLAGNSYAGIANATTWNFTSAGVPGGDILLVGVSDDANLDAAGLEALTASNFPNANLTTSVSPVNNFVYFAHPNAYLPLTGIYIDDPGHMLNDLGSWEQSTPTLDPPGGTGPETYRVYRSNPIPEGTYTIEFVQE